MQGVKVVGTRDAAVHIVRDEKSLTAKPKTDSDDQNFESLPGLGQSIPEGATFILT